MPLCANDYIPDSHRLAGTVEAGLLKCCFGRSSGLLSLPTSVAARLIFSLCRTDHILDALIALHWLRAQERVLFKMAVLNVQGLSWSRTILPKSAGSCRRSPWSELPPFCLDQPSTGAVCETIYRWRPGLPSHRTDHLEQTAGQRDLYSISFDLPAASENISLPGLTSWH